MIIYEKPQLVRLHGAQSCAMRYYTRNEMSPIDRRFAHCLVFHEAALYDQAGDLVPQSERQGGYGGEHHLQINPSRLQNTGQRELPPILSGRSIFLGLFMGHYGHFITETLSRCWSLAQADRYDHYVFYPFMFKSDKLELEKFHEFFFKQMAIPQDKIVFLSDRVIFEDVDVPEQLWVINSYANASLTPFYRSFGAKARGSRRLFLSLVRSARNRVANIDEVTDIFQREGFEILYPETLEIEKQMEAYNDAAVLAGFSGSALHNCIFAPPGCELIEVGDTRSPRDFLCMQKIANALACAKAHHIPFLASGPRTISGEHVLNELSKYGHPTPSATTSEIRTSSGRPKYLSRADVLNNILMLFEAPRYLEIGVNNGDTFFAVEAGFKVAVDPAFMFNIDDAKNKNPNARFHAVESDTYFGEIIAPGESFDVIYLDGMHTVEQTLRDFCNAIEFLSEKGVIVIDDIVPNSYHASLPDLKVSRQVRDRLYGNSDGSWMGDVYRLVFFIETYFRQYHFATVIENHGQLVVWKSQRKSGDLRCRSLEDVGRLPFENTITESHVYKRREFQEIMALLQRR